MWREALCSSPLARKRGPQTTASTRASLEADPCALGSPAEVFTKITGETLGQHHAANLLPNICPIETVRQSFFFSEAVFFHKPLNFGVIFYAAIENEFNCAA